MLVLRKCALVMLLALWVPMSSHCLLVTLSGLDSLSCCSHEEASTDASHEDECSTDACATIESGFYKTEKARVAAPHPELQLALFDGLELEATPHRSASPPLDAKFPPELTSSLHFRMRAAIPARAPTPPC